MKNFNWKQLLPHIIAIAIFLIVAFVYCKPAFEGKVLQQGDVTQWKGMAQNSFLYKEKHGHFPLWTNGMFSGMPAYQITGIGENPIAVGYIGSFLTLGLPKPVYFFFLACICFYFLTQVLKVNPYIGIITALGYAYATYNPIIISAGHDTKMNAIAYMPALIGSLLLLYEKKYLWGAALTAIATALIVGANHMQITYYAFIIAGIMSIACIVRWVKAKEYKHVLKAVSIAVMAVTIGILVNAITLFTTYEYAKKTIRGGSALATGKSNLTKTGLSSDYALSYSMYKTEPLVMMFPRMYGGSSFNLEVEQDKSKAIEALQQMPQQLGQQIQGYLRFYWGGIDGVGTAGPPYVGAVICFLALLGFVLLDEKYKWWILTTIALTTLMSWGKYFAGFNELLLKYLPMYNKFRAPSMIMVVPTFLLCMMAALTIDKIITDTNTEELWKKYKKGLMLVGSVFILVLLVYISSDFMSAAGQPSEKDLLNQINQIPDAQQKAAILEPVKTFINGLKEDRKSLFWGDFFRSFSFIAVAGIALWLYIKKKINTIVVLSVIGLFAFIDVILIDAKYLSEEHYQEQADYENNFSPSALDKQILQDTSYYRVFDVSHGINNAFNGSALTAYFHKSIGGYHPAKLSIYQDLIDSQLYKFPNCLPVIDMLNTKYIITPNQQGNQAMVQQNPGALGAAWFVKAIEYKNTPAEIIQSLSNFNPKDTAILDAAIKSKINFSGSKDSTASIRLIKNDNDIIEYESSSNSNGFAVFSEVYYDAGWKATIDGNEAPIYQTNYVLRGLQVPQGKHKITFEFKPASFVIGSKLAIGASAITWLLLIAAVFQSFRKRKETTA